MPTTSSPPATAISASTIDTEQQQRCLELFYDSQLKMIGIVNNEITLAIEQGGDAKKLENIILKDASLTATILKVASSVSFTTHNSNPTLTIKDAIVRIGLDGLRSICITAALIDSIPERHTEKKNSLLSCIASSLHTAIQARNLAHSANIEDTDAVYVTGLLQQLGELVFFSSPIFYLKEYKALSEAGHPPEAICKMLSGYNFSELSKVLSKHWAIEEALVQTEPAAEVLSISAAIATAVSDGWQSQAIVQVQEILAQRHQMNRESSLEHMKKAVAQTIQDLQQFCPAAIETFSIARQTNDSKPQTQPRHSDAYAQLDTLDKIIDLDPNKTHINTYYKILLDSVFNSVALERVAIAIVHSGSKKLSAQLVTGKNTQVWLQDFNFKLNGPRGILDQCITQKQALLLTKAADEDRFNNIDPQFKKLLGEAESLLVCPIIQSGQAVALLYADMAVAGWSISNRQFTACVRLCKFVSTAISNKA